jgi:hypothetical protein
MAQLITNRKINKKVKQHASSLVTNPASSLVKKRANHLLKKSR